MTDQQIIEAVIRLNEDLFNALDDESVYVEFRTDGSNRAVLFGGKMLWNCEDDGYPDDANPYLFFKDYVIQYIDNLVEAKRHLKRIKK